MFYRLRDRWQIQGHICIGLDRLGRERNGETPFVVKLVTFLEFVFCSRASSTLFIFLLTAGAPVLCAMTVKLNLIDQSMQCRALHTPTLSAARDHELSTKAANLNPWFLYPQREGGWHVSTNHNSNQMSMD